MLGAEPSGDAPAERALVAGRDVAARCACLIGVTRCVTYLRELIDDDTIVRQHVADRFEIAELRRQHGKIGGNLILELAARLDSSRAHRRELVEMSCDPPEHRGGIADESDLGL